MWTRLKSPFLLAVLSLGLVLIAITMWIGLGLANEWPTYDGMAKGGGAIVAISLGGIGLAMVLLAFRPGWHE
ncbi:MAG: hypothetical protein J4O08_02500 [Chloroflexi bacterium]|nr:hypothetical protein [Chloroflexota bacterium]MCI0840589.1 hypothetical protein [Chloroflexota bacterium]MCI0868563.1 hypothetical protein [Chloroflexota bacterium]